MGGLVYEGYSHASQAISELGGVEALTPILQNTNFFVMGILTMAFAIGLHRGIGNGRGSKTGPLLIGYFGAITVVQGFLPCDAGCDFESLTGTLHNATGLSGFLAVISGIVFISRRMSQAPNWSSHRSYSLLTAIAALLGLPAWIGVSKAAGIEGLNGVLQRTFIGLVLLWIEITAIRLFRQSLRPPASAVA